MRYFRTFSIVLFSFFFSSVFHHETPQSIISSRAPANDLNCLNLLSSFYTHQSRSFIENRIKLNDDVYAFYRSFVPIFYDVFLKLGTKKAKLARLEKYVATIGGDTHFENFGFIVDDNGLVHLLLNDLDDSTEGKLYYDVFRNYIAGNILTKKLDWKDYRQAYLDGIQGRERQYSPYVQKQIETYEAEIKKKVDSYVSVEGTPRFIKLKKPNRPVNSDEARDLRIALKKKFPQIEIFDQYVRIKEDGGSAGMLRFQVLAKTEPDSLVKWLDIKELETSSLDKVQPPDVPVSEVNRIKKLLKNIYEGLFNKSIRTAKIADKTFLIRFVDQFILGVVANDIPKDQMVDVARDEAYALGVMHGQSLASKSNLSIADYVQDWDSIAHEDLKDISEAIESDFDKYYKNSK
jgi:hypothetical protein